MTRSTRTAPVSYVSPAPVPGSSRYLAWGGRSRQGKACQLTCVGPYGSTLEEILSLADAAGPQQERMKDLHDPEGYGCSIHPQS